MGMTWLIQVTITIIRNIFGQKSGAVFLFYQNFLCLFWDLLSNFSSWGSWKTCLIKQPCKIYFAYLPWIYLSSLWGFNSFTHERLTYSLQNLLLRLKGFLRPLHRTSVQKTSHAREIKHLLAPVDGRVMFCQKTSGTYDFQWPKIAVQVPAPQRPHSLWVSCLDPQTIAICCWTRQLSCSKISQWRNVPLNYFSMHIFIGAGSPCWAGKNRECGRWMQLFLISFELVWVPGKHHMSARWESKRARMLK